MADLLRGFQQASPHLKGRSFKKAVTKGIGGIRNGSPVEQVDPS